MVQTTKTTAKNPATGALHDGEGSGVFDDEDAKDKDAGEPKHVIDYLTLKRRVDDFLSATEVSRSLAERTRDYRDGKQWTEAQIRQLKARKQAPIVNNRIKIKHNGLLGLAEAQKADPKAVPRNQNQSDTEASDAVTDGLRYAAQNTNLQQEIMHVADHYFCEGVGGVHIGIEEAPDGQMEVTVDSIPWNRIFYDEHSSKSHFEDARGKGFMMWMDEEDIEAAFPDADPDALATTTDSAGSGETFDDRPRWYSSHNNRKRHLVATHYFKMKGCWYLAIYTGGGYLLPPMESPYTDKYGRPDCGVELVSAYTDRDNNRYGELSSFLDLQDEINHRRSKALFLLSQRQTYSNRGASADPKKIKRELAKPDGHVEMTAGEFGKDFGILPTGDMAQGQMELLSEAKAEMDSQSYSAQLSGQRQNGDLSGVAIGKLQQAGITELQMLFSQLKQFRLRVYRQMWNRIRQYWDQEKWVRVTDDEESPRWVGFNVQVKLGDYLQEIMADESQPIAMRMGASAKLVMLEQQWALMQQQAQAGQQQGQPQGQQTPQNPLEEVIMTKNKPAELDMDIILDEDQMSVNVSEQQLDAILKFGAQNQFDITDLLDISNITHKKKLINRIEQRRQQQSQAQQQDPKLQMAAAKTAHTMSDAQNKQAKTQADTALTMAKTKQVLVDTSLAQKAGEIPFKGLIKT